MKTLSGFDSKDPKFDKLKYIRQLRGVVKWKNTNRGNGSIIWATGVGKTVSAIVAHNKIAKVKGRELKTIVIVPRTPLKIQWESNLRKAGATNFTVYVINTVSLNTAFRDNCNLLILDEAHLFVSEQFRNVFNTISYNHLMPLTATPERLDGEEKYLFTKAPIADFISQKEAIEKGWISNFIQFNLAVPVTRKEVETLNEYNRQVSSTMRRFEGFENMRDSMSQKGAEAFLRMTKGSTYKIEQSEVVAVIREAVKGMQITRERKSFLDNTYHKQQTVYDLIKSFPVRTVVFSESVSFSSSLKDLINKDLGNISVDYHSKLEGENYTEVKEKRYKQETPCAKFIQKLKDDGITYKLDPNTYTVKWNVIKKRSGTKVGELNLKDFLQKRKRVLLAAKAVDQGMDDDTIVLGIDASRTANPTQAQQRTGRVARNYSSNGQKAIKVFVNLYVPDWNVPRSSDEKKLRQCQAKTDESTIHWVDDLDELKEKLKELLGTRKDESFTEFN